MNIDNLMCLFLWNGR